MIDSYEHRSCEAKVVKEIETNPCVKLMLIALAKSGCPVQLTRHVSCEPCHGRMRGGFDSKNNQIVLCEDSLLSSSFGRVLSHELLHAFDHCTRRVDWVDPSHLACAEVRAANLTDCSPTQAVFRDFPGSPRGLKVRPVIVSAFWTKRRALFRRFGRKIREKLLRRGSRESSRVATKTWRLFITAAHLSTKATAKMPLTNGNREWADILGARLLGFSIGSTFSSMRTRSLILLQSLWLV